MKFICLVLILTLTFTVAHGQAQSPAAPYATKLTSYYNAGKADSIYAMLADAGKQAMATGTLSGAVQQLKAMLGNLVKTEFTGSDNVSENFIATFERSGPVLFLTFDKANKITRFFTGIDKRETPGSVTIKTSTAVLKGTLKVPEVAHKIPIVLLIAGSGPTDRDGNSMLMDGKPNYFLQLSDALNAKDIAVLRYDKRGVGQSSSTKKEADMTFDDIVEDAVAFIKYIKADPRFSKVIVAGHSEGSLAGMVACLREKTDGFISLSGPGMPVDRILKSQLKTTSSPSDYEKAVLIIDSIKTGRFTKQKLEPRFESLFHASVQPYLFSLMQYNPAVEIAKLNIPVLIVQGTHDVQVSVADAQLLKKAKPDAELDLVPGMSHVLKHGPTERQQNIASYGLPGIPLDPQLMPVLTTFINH